MTQDIKQLSRWIANSANRMVKLLEIGAPEAIIERERRLLVERISQFPVATGEAAQEADQLEQAAG